MRKKCIFLSPTLAILLAALSIANTPFGTCPFIDNLNAQGLNKGVRWLLPQTKSQKKQSIQNYQNHLDLSICYRQFSQFTFMNLPEKISTKYAKDEFYQRRAKSYLLKNWIVDHSRCDPILSDYLKMVGMFKGREESDRQPFIQCLRHIFEIVEHAQEVSRTNILRFDRSGAEKYEEIRNSDKGMVNKETQAFKAFSQGLKKFKSENCKNFEFQIKKEN